MSFDPASIYCVHRPDGSQCENKYFNCVAPWCFRLPPENRREPDAQGEGE